MQTVRSSFVNRPLRRITLGLAALAAAAPATALADGPAPFAWKGGDRVVLLGDTLIERDQKYGHLETILTAQNPDKAITFRNLGWSADTVRGLSRARFGPPSEGWQHLVDHVRALKPTVAIVGYGMADSFDGRAGLPTFVAGLNALLDVLAESGARVVLLSPIAHADLGRPLPDPAAHNADLKRYAEAIGKVAADRGARFVDLFREWEKLNDEIPEVLTDDGIHLTDEGYWLFGVTVARALQGTPEPWAVRFHHNGHPGRTTGTTVTVDQTRPTGVHFKARDAMLPYPPKKLGEGGLAYTVVKPRKLVAEGLPAGHYKLTVDGSPVGFAVNFKASDLGLDRKSDFPAESSWAEGVEVRGGPEFAQVEDLRKAINRKNELYFYRWRPQNETYLFGFRKHEQGNNAREIPLFDPLVADKEKEIARLKVPVPHVYELVKEKDEPAERPPVPVPIGR
jgi:lysophospholipase L1-like esterase